MSDNGQNGKALEYVPLTDEDLKTIQVMQDKVTAIGQALADKDEEVTNLESQLGVSAEQREQLIAARLEAKKELNALLMAIAKKSNLNVGPESPEVWQFQPMAKAFARLK